MWQHVHDGKKVYISKTEFCPICNSPLTITEWLDTDRLHTCEVDRECKSCNRYEYIWAYGESSIKIDGWLSETFLEDNALMQEEEFNKCNLIKEQALKIANILK
jgi:hypothetical protein